MKIKKFITILVMIMTSCVICYLITIYYDRSYGRDCLIEQIGGIPTEQYLIRNEANTITIEFESDLDTLFEWGSNIPLLENLEYSKSTKSKENLKAETASFIGTETPVTIFSDKVATIVNGENLLVISVIRIGKSKYVTEIIYRFKDKSK